MEGVYVIDQSAGNGTQYRSSLEKEEYKSPEASAVNSEFLAPFSASLPPVSPVVGHTMTKAAFFDAMRTRFGSDGSWRTGRNAGKAGATSGNGYGPGHGNDHNGISFFGSSKRARKSKISKPMAMLSSSTSVRDGFAERGRNGIGNTVNGKGKGVASTNFTLFGDGNNAGGTAGDSTSRNSHDNNSGNADVLPSGPARPDVMHANGHVFMSSPGAAVLAYDRSRSISDPARSSVHGSVGTGGSPGKRQSGSASAPSLGTGIVFSRRYVSRDTIDTYVIYSHTVGNTVYIRDRRFHTSDQRSW